MAQILPARTIARGGPVIALGRAPRALGGVVYSWAGQSQTLDDYLARGQVMGLLVLKDGKVAYENYLLGTDEHTQFVSWSMTKSFMSTLVGLAQADGSIGSIEDNVTRYVPELAVSGYKDNSIHDLLTMTSGVKFIEDYANQDSLEGRAWVEGTVTRTVPSYTDTFLWFKERIHAPGSRFYYASIEPAIAGWIVQRATGKHLADYLAQKIWSRLGAEHDASWVLDRPGGIEIGSCCISATLRDYGRFGLMILNEGRVGKSQLVPAAWIRSATRADPARPFLHPRNTLKGTPYGYQHYWWLFPEADRAVTAKGVFGQHIMVDFDDRVVIVMTANWDEATNPRDWTEAYNLIGALVRALR
jgi:CubicO group peptidase (beta-lactamase class C family)